MPPEGSYPAGVERLGLGKPINISSIGGGCISATHLLQFADGTRVVLKTAAGGRESIPADMFQKEAEGLRTLAAANCIRIPDVLAVSRDSLVLEFVVSAPERRGFAEDFGRRLANLHQHRGKACGFPADNYLGSSPQCNRPVKGSWKDVAADDGTGWPSFFLLRRLRFQVGLAANRNGGEELDRLLDRAETTILDVLSSATEPPSLLHGDLWSGNFIVDDRGEACLIDPAVYYGHRETDLAMTRLFGGFDTAFYAAYAEAAPLAAGHEDRVLIYQLYHLLNHLNLFGGGYFVRSKRILQRYAR